MIETLPWILLIFFWGAAPILSFTSVYWRPQISIESIFACRLSPAARLTTA
jgi:hypothetical protein